MNTYVEYLYPLNVKWSQMLSNSITIQFIRIRMKFKLSIRIRADSESLSINGFECGYYNIVFVSTALTPLLLSTNKIK